LNGTSTFLASCQQYFENGERNDGTFRFRPDISLPSYEVNCIFGKDSAVTEISPLDMSEDGFVFPKNESVRCYELNCFTRAIQYKPSLAQIEALMNLSKNCSQTVEHSCHQIFLSKFSSWLDRNGEWNSYWHGDKKSDEFGCMCASTETCQRF